MVDTVQITGIESLLPPEPVAFWPPAPGWFILVGIVLAGLIYVFVSAVKKRRYNRYRRLAIQQITLLRIPAGARAGGAGLRELYVLLKRVALEAFPREEVASLTGDRWVDFLKTSCPGIQLSPGQGWLLGRAGYEREGDVEVSEEEWRDLLQVAEEWILKH
jgi:hypothetical protein